MRAIGQALLYFLLIIAMLTVVFGLGSAITWLSNF